MPASVNKYRFYQASVNRREQDGDNHVIALIAVGNDHDQGVISAGHVRLSKHVTSPPENI